MDIVKNKGRVLIVYFSGVGGTRVVAEVLADLLKSKFFMSVDLEIANIDEAPVIGMDDAELQAYLSGFDMLIFGMPVFRMMPPDPMVEFIDRIKKFEEPVRAYTFMTKTGISGDATLELTKMLEVKNIIVCGFGEIIAPATDMNLMVKRKNAEGEDFGIFRNFAASIPDALFFGGRGALGLIREMAKDIFLIMFSERIESMKPKPKWYMDCIMWPIQIRFLDPTEEKMHEIRMLESCSKCGEKCVAWKCSRNAWTDNGNGPEFVRENCIACQMCVYMCPKSIFVCTPQMEKGTVGNPKLNRKFYREARKRFFGDI